MFNLKEKIGLISSLIIISGCILKAFQLPAAAITLVIGFLSFSLIFLPCIIFSQFKKKKIIHSIAGTFLAILILGVLFKLMYWPYANFLIAWSVTISLFFITPIYILTNYLSITNNDFTENKKKKNILIGIFILTILSLKYSMINLSTIPSPYAIP